MNRWPTMPLAELATVIRGVSFDKSQVSDAPSKNSIPILRAGNIQESLLTDSDLVYVPNDLVSDEQLIRRGDLAICMSSGSPTIVGKTAHLTTDWCGSVGAFCAIVRFNPKLHHRFGSYWFRSPAFLRWRDSNAKGANIQNLRRAELEGLPVPAPPFVEQERIVKLLDEADELRKLRAQADRRTADLIPALFHEMFVNSAKGHNLWPVVKVGDICEVKGGKRLPKGDEYADEPTPYRYIRVIDIQQGWVDGAALRFLKPETQRQISRYTVKDGDVIITIAGTIGVVAPVVASLSGANLTENAAKLVPRHSEK